MDRKPLRVHISTSFWYLMAQSVFVRPVRSFDRFRPSCAYARQTKGSLLTLNLAVILLKGP
jgi:hypothetical protein